MLAGSRGAEAGHAPIIALSTPRGTLAQPAHFEALRRDGPASCHYFLLARRPRRDLRAVDSAAATAWR